MNMRAKEEPNKIGKITLTGNSSSAFLQIVNKILAYQYIHVFERVRRNLEKRKNLLRVSWEMVSKISLKSRWTTSTGFPLSTEPPYHRRVRHFSFTNIGWPISITDFCLIWLEMGSRRLSCITPPRECSQAGWSATPLIFLIVLEDRTDLAFFPIPMRLSLSHNLSDMIMSDLTMPTLLILKDDPVRSLGLLHVQFTQTFPEFILLSWGHIYISPNLLMGWRVLSTMLAKKYENMKKFSASMFSLSLVTSWIAAQFNMRTFQWNAPIICPQLQLHLFQLLFATKSNSSSPEGLCSSTGAFVKLPHASSQNTISRLVSKTKRRPWCSRFQHGKDNLSAAVVQPVIASLPLEFKQLGACPAFHDSFLPGKKLVIAKLSRI